MVSAAHQLGVSDWDWSDEETLEHEPNSADGRGSGLARCPECYQSVKNYMKNTGAADVFKIPESPWLPAKITSQHCRARERGGTGCTLCCSIPQQKKGREYSLPQLHLSQWTPTLLPAGPESALAANACLMLSIITRVLPLHKSCSEQTLLVDW